MKTNLRISIVLIFVCLFIVNKANGQTGSDKQVVIDGISYELYPKIIETIPDITSPYITKEGLEIMIAVTEDNKYALISVRVENGEVYIEENGQLNFGKGNQLDVNKNDFPDLANTGLHSEMQLKNVKTITDIPVSQITNIARPGNISSAGFIAADEDILSVIIGDNRIVDKMNLKHPELAKCLFRVWNYILQEYRSGLMGRDWRSPIKYLKYNDKHIFISGKGSRGYQESIFSDGILGNAQINISRELDNREKEFLEKKYSELDQEKMQEFIKKLSSIHTGEMVPFYIMRYGFYEGHISYRADPIAIAFIFGLRRLKEIDKDFDGNLYEQLSKHHKNLL